PSSLAASCAPLWAASKKPMPSALTTSAIFLFSACATLATSAAEIAAVTSSFFSKPMISSLGLLATACPSSGRRGRFRCLHLLHGGNDEVDACRLQHRRMAILYARVGDHRGDPAQSAKDEAGAPGELRRIDKHDELVGLVDQLLLRLN